MTMYRLTTFGVDEKLLKEEMILSPKSQKFHMADSYGLTDEEGNMLNEEDTDITKFLREIKRVIYNLF